MKKLRILIADDINIIAESYKKIVLKKDNIEVVAISNNGEDEYNKIIALKPDIVITDNQMPKMNGIEVIQKILDSNIEKKPKFILVTGDISLFVKYNKLNISILYKPVKEESLLRQLDDIEDQMRNNEDYIKNEKITN